jgi:hypothetical protein
MKDTRVPRLAKSRHNLELSRLLGPLTLIMLHACPVTLVLSCAASRRLRFKD